MSADVLREAANEMRLTFTAEDGPVFFVDEVFFGALADWLDEVAAGWDLLHERCGPGDVEQTGLGTWRAPSNHPALAVARAYLGETS